MRIDPVDQVYKMTTTRERGEMIETRGWLVSRYKIYIRGGKRERKKNWLASTRVEKDPLLLTASD